MKKKKREPIPQESVIWEFAMTAIFVAFAVAVWMIAEKTFFKADGSPKYKIEQTYGTMRFSADESTDCADDYCDD